VEILAADGTTSSERLSMVKNLVACKGKSIIIGSFHDMHGKTSWDGGISTLIDFHSPILEARILGSLDMKSIYQKLHQFSDVMKLISKASCLSDNFKLQKFRNEIIPGLGLESRPLIALNMGALGQSSRALNTTLSPVTHSRLPVAAAPGQLTIKQIHSWRNLSGLLPDKSMYLFGSPITHSPSPALHNAGFEALGLPYTYKLYECSEPDVAKDFILAQVKSGAFGGASVTIPLKETLLAAGIYDTVTDSARDIGAVNTIIPSIEDGKDILIGDNTDWLGIRACITRFNPIGESKIGIVIGGGGTARAACYALGSLGCKTIRVWNRTSEKAIILAKSFSLVWPGLKFIPIVELCDVLSSLPSDSNVFVVATIPAEAQSSMELSELMAPIKNREAGRYDVLVELAYKPAVTPMMESFSILSGWNVVAGKQVLIEQGYEQFDRWTRLPVPKGVMRKALR
jgi:pentafunctional AROM polypeptide